MYNNDGSLDEPRTAALAQVTAVRKAIIDLQSGNFFPDELIAAENYLFDLARALRGDTDFVSDHVIRGAVVLMDEFQPVQVQIEKGKGKGEGN